MGNGGELMSILCTFVFNIHFLMWGFFFFFSSERKVDVKEDLRTIECLRGRLLAERQASKIANEDAEQMGNKVCRTYMLVAF